MTATMPERIAALSEIRSLLTSQEIYVKGKSRWVEQITERFNSGRDIVYYESEVRRMIEIGCIEFGDPESDEYNLDSRLAKPIDPDSAVRRVCWVCRPERRERY